jgi:hypothetical protein
MRRAAGDIDIHKRLCSAIAHAADLPQAYREALCRDLFLERVKENIRAVADAAGSHANGDMRFLGKYRFDSPFLCFFDILG